LAKECRQCRQRGFAVDNEEFHDRVCCIASPIRDASGAVVASIGISAPADRLPKRRWKGVGREVMGAAAEVSEKLGYSEEATAGVS
jgi:IclR family acetate operon transcriptional repressor